jgi:hypothetical protein
MDRYRLFAYSDDGWPLGAAIVIHAADDAEANRRQKVYAVLFLPNC